MPPCPKRPPAPMPPLLPLLLLLLLLAPFGSEAADVNGIVEQCLDRGGSPQEEARSYSSVLNDHPPGTGNARSFIDSPSGWKAGDNKDVSQKQEWLQLDLLATLQVAGVETAGHASTKEFVTSFRVATSLTADDGSWTPVEDNEVYQGDDSGKLRTTWFQNGAVRARYVRIYPLTWVRWITMRVGIRLPRDAPVIVTLPSGTHMIDGTISVRLTMAAADVLTTLTLSGADVLCHACTRVSHIPCRLRRCLLHAHR